MGKAGLWFKRLWKRLRSFRFTKKRVLLVSAVLAAAALGFGVWRFLRPAGGALPAMADAVRTTRLEKTTLSESITVTGTVESGSVANVTTSLSYPVKEIFVQVGDTVSEGDVICTLDSSDLEEQLAKRQEALAESRETAQKNYDKAVESYNSAAAKQTEAYNAYASAASALETARNTEYLNAANSVSSYQSAYDAALTAEQEAEVCRLRDEKYRSWEWTWGRTPAFTYEKSGIFNGVPIRVAYQAKRGIVSDAVIDCAAIDGALAAQLLSGSRLDPEGFAEVCRRLAGNASNELMDWLM